MTWKKPAPAVQDRFRAALPPLPELERRVMFGCAAAFVHGHFFSGVHEENIVIRLPGGLKQRFPELAEAAPFDPRQNGKGMKDWWLLPPAIANDAAALSRLLAAAFPHVAALPPKPRKAPRRTAAKL